MKRRFFALLAVPALRPTNSLKEDTHILRKLSERIHSEEKGFTLIELLVVIAAVGAAVSGAAQILPFI
jgi:prepilin-type N-terminal cleavage/methylation domain-containing protein